MKCPVCADERLVMTERKGVEIDYCPSCRGVWLDRGELDKIIERSASERTPQATTERRHTVDRSYYSERKPSKYSSSYGYRKKKKSLLSEIFDF
ncbi:zf-TFIIB domain-containing protein [Pleionea litopenaei]|uniref:Zf-TFIIB domain-containing protein n=1 Tax=Pleionea litopenaei TaxID=3070815 RepID=A0AA51RSP4_9GAMM|nr:zf-TFIIB domain-containing protein [Pleionea sp. HL-JVS1]WMS86810.1 zf-TFIIB domain-containing protein [Pleionea sp. HL-JVS1]